jgi:hypothetical protein
MTGQRGQALMLVVVVLAAVLVGALILGGVARGIGVRNDAQRAADLGALAAARAMRDAYPRLFTPAVIAGRANARHLARSEYLALARNTAIGTARANGAREVQVSFPGASSLAPVRVRVTVGDAIDVADGMRVPSVVAAEAELVPPGGPAETAPGDAGEYPGPFAERQGKRMRPDVARAFDRMSAAARADGVALIIVSAFRSDAEQATLFAANPDPRWVAPPGKSLHRLGTELDLGPKSAYGWLRAHAERFPFKQRYSWEPWHYGYVLNASSATLGFAYGGRRADGESGGALPAFVPERFGPAISRASQRWSVSAALLAAQLWQESRFNPFAQSPAGAQGIAQFMPGTARGYGLRNPFDPDAAIDAQAHLMRDLLRRFGSVPLALAAYNAGPARVEACGCVPRIPETLAYVAEILGLLRGAGDPAGAGAGGLLVRLVA